MASTIARVVFHIVIVFLSSKFYPAKANLIRAGYWDLTDDITSSDLDATLFTHLICHSAGINSTSYQLSLSRFGAKTYSNFQEFVKRKNPSVTTLLYIGGVSNLNDLTFSSMLNDSSYRKSFIDSSIKLARDYGFQGLDFFWHFNYTSSDDMSNLGMLFQEWRVATKLEAQKSNQSQLILTSRVGFSPKTPSGTYYPVEFMQQNLNWVHFFYGGFRNPSSTSTTAAPVSLFDPSSTVLYTDYGIKEWLKGGLSANKLVLCLPFYGYSWTLANPEDSGFDKTATGPASTRTYKEIKSLINNHGSKVDVMYNSTYVVNYCLIGTAWVAFDDVESIKAKISYAKKNGLLGCHAWKVFDDDNWVLSQAAAGLENNNNNNDNNNKKISVLPMLAIILTTAAAVTLLLGFSTYYFWIRKLKFKGSKDMGNYEQSVRTNEAAAEEFNSNALNLVEYTYSDLEAATNRFSIENKLGEGGFGPVYKGVLPDGQVIAIKKLSKTSKQGFEEFKNEVTLTSKLQHVNLVRVLGFCIDREEHILIYEYMPKKSLDYYLFHPIRSLILNWEKRVHIIQGVVQGLLYLQVYSRFPIIHRDLKASNVLLDEDMKPKISDFGIAKTFEKEDLEANTERIVGTYGYIPPEYFRRGIYSRKSDVYSFGILLLQIISGKKNSNLHGLNENLSLLNYAYELWEDNKGMEFVDPSLDDTESSCKLMRCLQIALLCVQKNQNDRPSMLEVSSMLNNETTNIDTPKKPAFSNQDDQNESALQPEICSVNDVTISDMTPR